MAQLKEAANLELAVDARKGVKGTRDFNRGLDQSRRAAKQTRNELGQFQKKTDSVGKTASKAGKMVAGLFAGLSATVAVTQATRSIAGFEMTMATLRGVTRIPSELDARFIALRDTARQLGATTKFSAREAGEGLLFLARAGFTAEESIAAIPATLNLAAAGNLALGEAADFASNILSAFNLDAAQTVRVVDTLIATSNRANTDVRQLAEAMKYVAPIAGGLGIQVEDTAAMVGVLGDRGIQASMAGTNLRGVMLALTGPTDAAKKSFKEMGLTAEQLNPELNDMTTILQRLGDANMTVSQANEIFGRRNAAAAVILAGNVARVKELTEENRRAAGEAQNMADIMSKTLSGAFLSLKSAIDEAFLSVGDAGFLGALKTAVRVVTGAIRILVGMEHGMKENAGAALILARAIKAASAAFGVFLAYKAVGLFIALGGAIKTATAAMWGFNVAASTNPIGAIVTAIGAAIAAFVYFKDHVIMQVGDEMVTLGDIVGGTWDLIRDRAVESWRRLVTATSAAYKAITGGLKSAAEWITNTWNKLGDRLGIRWGDIFQTHVDIVKWFVNKSIGLIRLIGKAVAILATQQFAVFRAISSFDWANPIMSAKIVAAKLKESLSPTHMVDELKKAWQTSMNTDYVGAAVEFGKKTGSHILLGIKSMWESGEMKGVFEALLGPAGLVALNLDQVIANAQKRAWNRTFDRAMDAAGYDIQKISKVLASYGIGTAMPETTPYEESTGGAHAWDLEAQLAALNKRLPQVKSNLTSTDIAMKQIDASASSAKSSFDQFFGSIVTGAERGKNALMSLLQALGRIALNTALAPLTNLLGGAFSEFLGNIMSPAPAPYSGIGPQNWTAADTAGAAAIDVNKAISNYASTLPKYGRGTTVYQPQLAWVGDRGPEKITPLDEARSGGMVVNNYIQTPNYDSFRRSQRQLGRDTRRAFGL